MFLGNVSNEGKDCGGVRGEGDDFEGHAINGGGFGGVLILVGSSQKFPDVFVSSRNKVDFVCVEFLDLFLYLGLG